MKIPRAAENRGQEATLEHDPTEGVKGAPMLHRRWN